MTLCAQVNALKDAGNSCFKKGAFEDAIDNFTRALKLQPRNHILLSNRRCFAGREDTDWGSAAYASLNQWKDALADARKCVDICPSFSKVAQRTLVA